MERKLLVALVARAIEEKLCELGKSHGEILEKLGVQGADAALLFLEIIEEACELLKSRAKE